MILIKVAHQSKFGFDNMKTKEIILDNSYLFINQLSVIGRFSTLNLDKNHRQHTSAVKALFAKTNLHTAL